jgi:cyclophilin family peptidyl-prolyl cis-trans isomerase
VNYPSEPQTGDFHTPGELQSTHGNYTTEPERSDVHTPKEQMATTARGGQQSNVSAFMFTLYKLEIILSHVKNHICHIKCPLCCLVPVQTQVIDQLKDLCGQVTDIKLKNSELTAQLTEVKSQLMSLRVERNSKINQIIRMQGEIKCDMVDIRSNMTFLSDSVNALISSTMDAILEKMNNKNDGQSAGLADQPEKVSI